MTVLASVNYFAILVCGVVAIGFGYLWYSPFLFGKLWLQEIDQSEEDLKRRGSLIRIYGLTFLGHLVMAYVLARIISYTNSTTVIECMRLSFLCWLGFTGATMLVNAVYERKSIRLVAVDGGYHLIVLLVFGIILGSFQ